MPTRLQDVAVKALLISHPSNPLGTCYTPDQLGDMLQWCLEREVHLIRLVRMRTWLVGRVEQQS